MNNFLTKLLEYYSLSEDDYKKLTKNVSVSDLPDAHSFYNFEKFINRIEKAIKTGEQIVIYGDYDADGILSTSIVKSAFNKRGVDVFSMIPSRYKDGYGLNTDVVRKFKKRDISLIITVDNGISAFEAVALSNELGIDVLISDHHALGAALPNAHSVIHPALSDLPELNSCGAYMALLISYGILGYYDPYLVSLAGIATLADMMPLRDRNRTVVKLALEYLNTEQYFPLVRLNDSSLFNEKSLTMRLIPKINALGRLSQNYESNVLVEYFTTSDVKRIYDISAYVEKVYKTRKAMSEGEELSKEDLLNPAIILISDELEGVLGLIAQNYVLRYNKPAFIFTEASEDPNLLKGSVRSKVGFNVVDSFNYVSEYILNSGGHNEAGGLTIKKSDFSAFSKKINEFAKENPFIKVEEKYLEVSLDELTPEAFALIKSLGPYGEGFKAPLFKVSPINLIKYTYSRDGKHIITPLSNGVKLVGFFLAGESKNPRNIAFSAEVGESEFRGVISNELRIKEFFA